MPVQNLCRIFKHDIYFSTRRKCLRSTSRGNVVRLIIIFTIIMIMTNMIMKERLSDTWNLGTWLDGRKGREIIGCDPSDISPVLQACAPKPIVSDKSINVSYELLSFEELNSLHGNDLFEGGHFRPVTCRPDQKVAIVIPYRDREKHLKLLLKNLHPFLKKQDIDYTFIVVEQAPGSKFNRGMLRNIGFVEALKICNFNCFFFHDIDMVPNDLGNVYKCGDNPRQHTRDLARWNHKASYSGSFGGVVSMTTVQFQKANGYTNIYFEWGMEDEEMGKRLKFLKMKPGSYPFKVGSYVEFGHAKDKHYKRSWALVKSWQSRMKSDGLNSLNYTVEKIEYKPLYIHLHVNINISAVNQTYKGHIMIAGKDEVPFE